MAYDLVLISPYPSEGKYSHTKSALASFTHNLIEGFLKTAPSLRILLLADSEMSFLRTQESSTGSRIKVRDDTIRTGHDLSLPYTIKRTWERNHPLAYLQLLNEIRSITTKKILIQFEWNMFGSFISLLLFPLFLLLLKLRGKKTYVVLHGILTEPEKLSMFSPLINTFLSIGSKLFYILTSIPVEKIIVTEKYLQEKLCLIGISTEKVQVIPHGVDTTIKPISQTEAKQKLGVHDPLMVYFGFLTYYKGPDVLLKLFQNIKDFSLTFVGGPSKHSTNDPAYQAYIKSFEKEAAETPQVSVTDFVTEDQIQTYLSAADLMVLPYRMMLSSSGPLSFAATFEKPVLFSKPLSGYFQSEDVAEALTISGLTTDDLTFDLNDPTSLNTRAHQILNNPQPYIHFSRLLKEKRRWEIIAQKYLNTLAFSPA